MKQRMMNNLGLKILALLFACALWLIVVNINDPIKTVTYSGVKVEILNEEAITEQGKVYEILDNTGTVSVTVTAKRSAFDSINTENIHAVADMKEISFMDTVRINAYCDKGSENLENIKSNTENLKLQIEDIKKVQLVITPVTVGEPAQGYVLGDVSTNQTIVRMSGPDSVISQITKATVTVDVGGMKSSITTSADLKLYDADNRLIENGSIKKNIDEVTVTAQILETKAVPVLVAVDGTPASGYMITGEVVTDPETILIAGSSKNLAAVKQIEIPEGVFSIAGQSSTVTANIDIRKYLPENVMLADSGFSGKVTVTAAIEKTMVKTLEIPKRNLAISNVPPGYSASFVDMEDSVTVELTGLKEVLDSLYADNIKGVVDLKLFMEKTELTELAEGTYQTEFSFELPEGAAVSARVPANIVIEKPET